MAEQVKEYLDYLDKEMTIMGILSTFCVAAVALVLDRIGNADLSKPSLFAWLWSHEALHILIGSGWLVIAALFFYLQRSTLAFYYGGLAMSVADPSVNERETAEWLKDANSWATWLRYRTAFMCLVLSFLTFSIALVGAINPARQMPLWWLWVLPTVIALEQIPYCSILYKFRYDNAPFQGFFSYLRARRR
jgi:hypothetical protein